jgi:hypothetical protein
VRKFKTRISCQFRFVFQRYQSFSLFARGRSRVPNTNLVRFTLDASGRAGRITELPQTNFAPRSYELAAILFPQRGILFHFNEIPEKTTKVIAPLTDGAFEWISSHSK